MARLSLYAGIVAMLGETGCWVTEVPDYSEPQRFGPLVTVISPPLHQVIVRNEESGTNGYHPPIDVVVDLYGETGNQYITANFVLDYESGTRPRLEEVDETIEPLHLGTPDAGKVTKKFQYSLSPTISPGCHSLTLFLRVLPSPPQDAFPVATWWLDIDDDGSARLSSCYGAESVAVDGGATAGR